MPNGKSQIDCCYCVHFESEYEGSDAMYEKGNCNFHKTDIPSTLTNWNHRVCKNFEGGSYLDKNLQREFIQEKFKLFGEELQEKILYEFHYNNYESIKKLKNL